MNKCPTCNEFVYDGLRHKCNPAFYVWPDHFEFCDAYEDRYYIVHANNSENATIKFAEKNWEFPDSATLYVLLRSAADQILEEYGDFDLFTDEILEKIQNAAEKFELESEIVRNFYATKIEKKDEEM